MMIGNIVNTIAILIGGSLGLFIGDKISESLKDIVMQGLSLAVLLIGLKMALQTQNMPVVIFSLVLGGIIGEFLSIKTNLDRLGDWIESKLDSESEIAAGFVHTSLIYCVGAMAITGAIQDGLGNPSTLYSKSLLDGFSAIAFSSTMGPGVLVSAISVFLYQGSIALLAGWSQQILIDPVITEMTAVGGLLIVAISLNLLEIVNIKVGNLLPAIFISIFLVYLF
ncbi:putative membrane protein YqgA involved in biofilm formation [Halanaerobacter jeridensis]|uniref:Membrane protein YqgA involved in biofilm formation n=2 Tax=Halanaerobacter jeridensis TaxID=706427 RepID=A0A938XWN1_9FIRM|nr:DUF554 domain-containing protein [Halanaerobacter jeridensis]MBM7557621.1 putative membrane protein YqgA involved in biofilm formation [Halanaerobacter jeridensis]